MLSPMTLRFELCHMSNRRARTSLCWNSISRTRTFGSQGPSYQSAIIDIATPSLPTVHSISSTSSTTVLTRGTREIVNLKFADPCYKAIITVKVFDYNDKLSKIRDRVSFVREFPNS